MAVASKVKKTIIKRYTRITIIDVRTSLHVHSVTDLLWLGHSGLIANLSHTESSSIPLDVLAVLCDAALDSQLTSVTDNVGSFICYDTRCHGHLRPVSQKK